MCSGKMRALLPTTNGQIAKDTAGIPQASVLGPIIFTLNTSDLRWFTCTQMAQQSIASIIKWMRSYLSSKRPSAVSFLVPHPKKCEGMILSRKKFTGPYPSLTLDGSITKLVPLSRLLGITEDDGLTRAKHLSELKKGSVAN